MGAGAEVGMGTWWGGIGFFEEVGECEGCDVCLAVHPCEQLGLFLRGHLAVEERDRFEAKGGMVLQEGEVEGGEGEGCEVVHVLQGDGKSHCGR